MKRRSREMINDMDYIKTLNKEDKRWLFKAASGISNANRKFLSQLNPEGANKLFTECSRSSDASRRDIMNKFQRMETEFSLDAESEFSHLLFTEGQFMSNFEDAIIEKIDNERKGKAYTAGSYGNNSDVPAGADVVICIEGHHLQNRLGRVVGKRHGQLLVTVQTTKGDVSLYVSPYEIAWVNQAKKVG